MIVFKKIHNKSCEFEQADVFFEIPNHDINLDELREEFDNFCRAIGYIVPHDGEDIDYSTCTCTNTKEDLLDLLNRT